MSAKARFGCLPTMIGSMPHTSAEAACQVVLRRLPDIPAWPQLPLRSPRENMYAQFSEGFPGVAVDEGRICIDRSRDIEGGLEKLYEASENSDLSAYGISRDYAAGLHAFLAEGADQAVAVKGQVTGPISWGLAVADGAQWAIYDDTLADAIARHLRLKAAWESRELGRISRDVIMFVDEPYLTSLGSAFVSLPPDKVSALLEETLSGITGFKGIHCCGNTDWSLLLRLPIDILSFDAYSYIDALTSYANDAVAFLERGGVIAWGIAPNEEETLAKESTGSLKDRLEDAMARFAGDGLPFRQVVEQSLITPCCGLASLPPEAAEQALAYLGEISGLMRQRYLKA